MSAPAKSPEAALLDCLGCLGWMVASTLIAFPLRVYALRTLWRWFLVADFGFRPLTWHAAAGLLGVVAFATMQTPRRDHPADQSWGFTFSLTASLMALALGWLYHVVTRGLS